MLWATSPPRLGESWTASNHRGFDGLKLEIHDGWQDDGYRVPRNLFTRQILLGRKFLALGHVQTDKPASKTRRPSKRTAPVQTVKWFRNAG
jgi:hypothetical protein